MSVIDDINKVAEFAGALVDPIVYASLLPDLKGNPDITQIEQDEHQSFIELCYLYKNKTHVLIFSRIEEEK